MYAILENSLRMQILRKASGQHLYMAAQYHIENSLMKQLLQTTVVGSFPVPDWLKTSPNTQTLQDAIRHVLDIQERIGIDVIGVENWDAGICIVVSLLAWSSDLFVLCVVCKLGLPENSVTFFLLIRPRLTEQMLPV